MVKVDNNPINTFFANRRIRIRNFKLSDRKQGD